MKAKITRNGVYDAKGKPIAIGTVLTVKGDVLPGYLVGKAEPVEGKTAVTNPAEGAKPAEDQGGEA